MMEQEPGMKGFTELATWAFLQPGNGQKANISLLKDAVRFEAPYGDEDEEGD